MYFKIKKEAAEAGHGGDSYSNQLTLARQQRIYTFYRPAPSVRESSRGLTAQGRFYRCHYNVDGTYASSNSQSGSKIDADSGTKCADGIDAIGSQYLRCNNVHLPATFGISHWPFLVLIERHSGRPDGIPRTIATPLFSQSAIHRRETQDSAVAKHG